MYLFKSELTDEIQKKYKVRNIGRVVGITEGYLSQIINSKKTCPKRTAYAITKYLNEDAEIEKYFERLK